MMAAAGNQRTSKLVKDVQDYHASTTDVVKLAAEAGVKKVAFYHLVPVPPNAAMLNQFTAGLPEDVVVTADGMLFELAQGTDTVELRQLF
jgi:ribonuclease Z